MNLSVREMDYLRLSVLATDPEQHALNYTWSIAQDGTGLAYIKKRLGASAEVAFPWAASPGGSFNGRTVEVKVVVSHADATAYPETLEGSFIVTIQGVNHPPVPVIGGNTGTPTARIPTGKSVCVNCYQSTQPDSGDIFRPSWALGSKSGGAYITPFGDVAPVLMATDSGESCFTVIKMTAPIDQKINLVLQDGLHQVPAQITAYLAPATTTTPTNRAPTVSFPTNPVQAALGGTAQLVADAEDLDGDVLDYSFVFLQTGATVDSGAISVVTLSSTKKRVTATIPAATVGSYGFRFTARERSTTDHKSAVGTITLIVSSGTSGSGGPQPEDPNGTTTDCTGNTPPTITFSPSPWPNKPVFTSGSPVSIVASGYDASQKEAGGMVGGTGIQTGVTMTWNLSQLTQAGGSATPSNVVRTDKRYTDSTLSFTAPTVSSARDIVLTVTAKDVFLCSRTISFAIRVEPQQTSTNQPPVAKIQYKVGTAAYANAPATPVTVETGSAVTVTLNAGTSTDDAVPLNLTYTWAKTAENIGMGGGVTLSSTSGATTNIQITAHTKGTLTVTLTAKDQGNLTNAATISFNFVDPAQKPTAQATVKVGGTVVTGPVEEGAVVTLDGSASSRPGSTDKTGLTYQWTKTEGPDVTITNADKAIATFTAPAASETATQLKFKLIVTDAGTASDPKEVTVQLSSPSFYFSQVAVGPLGTSEFRTVLLLVNRNEQPANGVLVKFFGQDGNPMDVTINGAPWDSQPFDIQALGAKQLVFTGTNLKSGWAKVSSGVKIAGLLQYQIVGEDQKLETEVGLFSTEAATKFATFYDASAETAIAVANPMSQAATVRIRLIDEKNGNEVLTKNLFVQKPGGVLPGMHHDAKFLDSNYLGELPPDFALGTLLIESNVPVCITVVKTKGGVVFSTLPVASTR